VDGAGDFYATGKDDRVQKSGSTCNWLVPLNIPGEKESFSSLSTCAGNATLVGNRALRASSFQPGMRLELDQKTSGSLLQTAHEVATAHHT
jgi:hypothetical protein